MALRAFVEPIALIRVKEVAALLQPTLAERTILNQETDIGSAQTAGSFSPVPHTITYAVDLSWLAVATRNPAISCIITTPAIAERQQGSAKPLILHERPAEAYHLLHNLAVHERTYALDHQETFPVIAPCARIHPTAVVEGGVHIGEGVQIGAYTVVKGPARIGRQTRIEEHCAIGIDGLFSKEINHRLVSFKFYGGVWIGENCHIHARSSIVRSPYFQLETRLEDEVSLGVACNVGHDCVVGRSSIISSHALLCGRSVVGPGCWIGAGAVIRDGVEIGAGASVRLGAVVVQNLPPRADVSGNFARPHFLAIRDLMSKGRHG